MTEPWKQAGDIRRHLLCITDHYDAALQPGTLSDDSDGAHKPPASGEPVNLDHVQARADAQRDLAYWAHFVIDELKDGPTTTAHAADIYQCAKLIDTWALAICERHPDDADNLLDDAARNARRLKSIAQLWRTRRMTIGPCPEQILTIGPEGFEEFVRCPGTLTATLSEKDGDEAGLTPGAVACDTTPDHAWTPWQWRDLGRRMGTSIA